MQCLLVSIPGTTLPDETARWLEAGLSGVILFARNFTDLGGLDRLCREIREVNGAALIALDEEGGEVTRLEAATGSSWPGARTLGVVDDVALTERCGALIGSALAGAGANVNLAPVADVATCAANPVIGNRAFAETPSAVGRHISAFVRGTQSAGVAACAKHFPGHGATTVDSHLDLPTVELDEATLRSEHLAPFADAIAAGVAMLMTAHVRYRSLDDVPATVSSVILQGLARRELGFDGVIVTDALGMKAISGHIGVVGGALGALGAGADLLCVDGDFERHRQVIAGIDAAITGGVLPLRRVEQAAERVAQLARTYAGMGAATASDRCAVAGDAKMLGMEAARRAVRSQVLPPPLSRAPHVVELTAVVTGVGDVRARLTDALRRRDEQTTGGAFAADAVPTADDVLAAAGDRPLVVATRDAFRRPAQAELVAALRAARPDTVVVGLGTAADAVLAPGRFVPARGSAPPNVAAAAEVLLPDAPASGS